MVELGVGPGHILQVELKVLCDFQWQADRICSKETPDWKALDAAKAIMGFNLMQGVVLVIRELIT